MITSYKKLTGKYLMASKRKSILTIIGIVLSVALITCIGLFLKGMQSAEVESMKGTYGSWHVEYLKVDSDLLSKVKSNPKVSRCGLMQQGTGINVGKDITLEPLVATDKALELLTYRVNKGRLPNNKNEVALEKWTLSYIDKNAKIGDTIKFQNKKYKLVGFLDNSVMDQIKNKSVLLSKNNKIDTKNSILLAEVSSKTNLNKAVNELDSLASKKTVQNNSYLLDVEGSGSDAYVKSLLGVVGIIIGIVVIATIAVIYNSFQISVVERLKQFGLLRAIGMTPRQLKNMVLREASILAAVSVPIGLLLGILAINIIEIVFKLIGSDSVLPMKVSISPQVLLISAAIGIVSVYISAVLPALFAGRISPLVAINSRTSITKEKIKNRKSRIVGKIFGFEGELAAKNIKRNKKRYRITVFSIIISVVLFISFKSFMDMALRVNGNTSESNNINFSVVTSSNGQDQTIDDKSIKDLTELSSVNRVYKTYSGYKFSEYIPIDRELNDVRNLGGVYNRTKINGTVKTMIKAGYVEVYDKNALEDSKKYVTSGNIDENKLNDEDGVIVVINGTLRGYKKRYSGKIADVKVGDEIELQQNNKDIGNLKKVKVLAVVKSDPFNDDFNTKGLKLITTPTVAEKLSDVKDIKPYGVGITIKDLKQENTAKSQIDKVVSKNPSLQVIDNIDSNRQSKSSVLMVEILVYGFIVVVSLIGSVNIINTLTTNIILRKREFAALKAIGLTQRGLKKMIVLEGLLYGIVGTIYGSVISTILSYLMFRQFQGIVILSWNIPWVAIAIAGSAALIIGYISVLAPLGRIKRDNIIETIREDY
ncbi:MAG: ABC transporter permease [Clostridium sp.]|nr:ABC transporter permease [Clostridium sp.]